MKFVFLSWPQYSHVNASIPIVESLLEDGHEVYYFCSDGFSGLLDDLPVNYITYNQDTTEESLLIEEMFLKHKQLTPKINTLDSFLEFKAVEAEFMIKRNLLLYESVLNQIKDINPHFIFRDACAYFGKIIGEKLNIKTIGYCTNLILTKPFINSNPIEILSLVENFNLAFLKRSDEVELYNQIEDIHIRLSAKYSVPKLPVYSTMNPEEEVNLTFGSSKLQPCFGESKKTSNYVIKPSLFSKQSNSDLKKEALIYVSMGSLHIAPEELYNSIIGLFKNTNYQVIISLAKEQKEILQHELPSNITVETFVDQNEILRRASLFITHGGYNSICEGVFYEVPMIVFPITSDQFLNSYLVQQLNIGRRLEFKELNPKALQQKIVELAFDDSIESNLNSVKASFNESYNLKNVLDKIINN